MYRKKAVHLDTVSLIHLRWGTEAELGERKAGAFLFILKSLSGQGIPRAMHTSLVRVCQAHH